MMPGGDSQLQAVHQFHAGAATGDGVTNSMFFIRSLLRELGYRSDIFAGTVPEELRGEVLPHTRYRSGSGQLLLHHHSMGHDLAAWLDEVADPRILVYHNITPPAFFAEGSPERHYARYGHELLHWWADRTWGGIALSPYNARDLEAAGYQPIVTLPLLVDLDRLASLPTQPIPAAWQGEPLLLFVGRIAGNKRQDMLIDLMAHLRHMVAYPGMRLVLAGAATDPELQRWLQGRVAQLGLEDQVVWAGKVSDPVLRGLYEQADLFVCASDHEGFGMPLLEAQVWGVPILARDTSNVAHTVGEGGLVLANEDPARLAAAAAEVLADADLRSQLRKGVEANLARYARPTLRAGLDRFLRERFFEAQRAGGSSLLRSEVG